jgi:hypothetical protein
MSTPGKPDLEQIVAALIADANGEELGGRDAALAAFRAARQRDGAAGSARWYHGRSFRRPFADLSRRLAAVGAAVVVGGGVAAAAYAQALPGPVQQFAHTVFAPLGVPNGQSSAGTGSTDRTVSQTTGGKTEKGSPSPRTPSPQLAGGYLVTAGVSRAQVPAGTVLVVTGRVTDDGRPAAGVRVRLFERIAGTTTQELVAIAMTGPRGGYRLVSPPLTTTTVFRVAGPDAAHSVAIRVAVASQ